ncbi:hypothetical protein HCN44_005025 [Aphidius gifuensis]|uniref:Histone-lysine N-methyltransferase NSD2 n=1 Tax=Aphidius gifuensis TaxID=684658 RepID=A0A834XTV4_APHGI|nr:hypothetical protein HCN44_005025 [Aphidius gifuensis]
MNCFYTESMTPLDTTTILDNNSTTIPDDDNNVPKISNSDIAKSDEHDHKTENGVVNDDKIKSITAVVNSDADIKKDENVIENNNSVSVSEINTESPNDVDDKSTNDCIEEEKMEVVDNNDKSITGKSIKWSVGQLTWAHISHYPYWPCIITLEPNTDIFTKEKSVGRRKVATLIHVQYFGDKGRHGWVSESWIMEYTGIDHFNKLAVEVLKNKKKFVKYAGFIVKSTIQKKWQIAVDEAEKMLLMSIEDRIDIAEKTCASKIKKRGLINNNNNFVNNDKNIINLTNETPPTPPSSIKDSSDESIVIRKTKRTRRKKSDIVHGDFEVYYEETRHKLINFPPESTDDDIRAYLKTTWDSMATYLKNKYKPKKLNDFDCDLLADEQSVKSTSSIISKTNNSESESDCENNDADNDNNKIDDKTTADKSPSPSTSTTTALVEATTPSSSSSSSSSITSTEVAVTTPKKYDSIEEENFKCIDCLSGVAPACFVCNEREEERIRCSMSTCGKHYHASCLKLWPQSHWQGGRIACPYHVCHTCTSDNPQSYQCHSRAPHDRFVRCVRCPSAYHAASSCLPAGSKILTGTHIICPKHYISPNPPLNAAWCFLCTRGGSLICCDTCPTSFHPECLGINAPDGAFICEDCETGRLPLYGEVVWCKLGNYRWWPSRICYPNEIPLNLETATHSNGEFCVEFFGTHNYYWAHRGRCFLYQDGDLNAKVTAIGKKNVDESYKIAVDEANDVYQKLKNEKIAAQDDTIPKRLKPPPYVKLRINKPVGNVKPVEVDSIVACECNPQWSNPCSSDTDCLNRILSIECSPDICPAGEKCNNQAFVRRVYPAMEPFHTAGRGWGLRTLDNIKSGQFVIEYVGEVIDEAEYKRRLHRKKELRNENYYFLTIDNYRLIDAEPKGNLSRFMNHSCQPNCETQKWTVNGDTRIGLFALRDISNNEELTFNYNLASDGETRKPCLCGASNCSGYIGLKVQKPQLTVIQQTKIETAEKVKKQRRRRIHPCWKCGQSIIDTDNLLKCQLRSCFKRYHTDCANIIDNNSKFICPWHHCLTCSDRTASHCTFCSTAYCQNHLEGNLTEQKENGGYLCKIHEDLLFEDDQDFNVDNKNNQNLNNVIIYGKQMSPEYPEPEESDDDFDKASLLADSDSPIEPLSPRGSIIEVVISSEEGDDDSVTQENNKLDNAKDDKLDNNSLINVNDKIKSMGYTTHQLNEIIGIGGGI